MSETESTSLVTTLVAVAFGGLVTFALMGGFKDKAAPEAEAKAKAAAAADAAARELLAEAPSAAGPAAGKKKKKKKKKKAGASAPPAAAATAAAPSTEEGADTDSDATPKATKKKKKKKKQKGDGAAAAAATGGERKSNGVSSAEEAAVAPGPPPPQKAVAPRQPIVFAEEEEWVSVKAAPKRNKPPNSQRKKPAAASGPTSEAVVIDAKKVGIIIGPKGATMKAIEEATGCRLEVNAPDKDKAVPVGGGVQKATVLLSGGDAAQTAKARAAVRELATKGFATLLQTDATFGESYVEVHPRYLSEIVGKGGKIIQAIQKGCNVTLTIPPTDWRPDAPAAIVKGAPPSCRVGIAGSAADAKRAREVVQALVRHHHHDLTHPGQVHKSVWVPWERRGIVVGPRGGEMKHIRGNYGVEVYLPHDDDGDDDGEVLVVGRPAAVDRAIVHIENLLARDAAKQESRYSDEAY